MIFLDTDVILDVALDRAPHAGASAELLDLLERGPLRTFVSWHTMSNLYSLLRPARGQGDAREFLAALTRFVRVAPVDADSFRVALSLPFTDLEAAMQVASASTCGALYIGTRNLKDFEHSPIPALTPRQLLDELG